MREMPQHFVCDACQERQHVDLLCTTTSDAVSLYCVRCCTCPVHSSHDLDGTVVFDNTMTWRGLHDSPSRARRNT